MEIKFVPCDCLLYEHRAEKEIRDDNYDAREIIVKCRECGYYVELSSWVVKFCMNEDKTKLMYSNPTDELQPRRPLTSDEKKSFIQLVKKLDTGSGPVQITRKNYPFKK